ncbi:MAG: prepilin-type N-terminal cleavage/methylation domain-containing protein [Halanaerobium sp.]|nr:prepilin-type N-terminal cleavage/methylation domain-containing protein [Halanaerobium sp.]
MFERKNILFGNKQGFGLIELLVVIILLGTIIAIAVPMSRTILGRTRLETAADKIVVELRWSQMEAILKNRPYRVEIYPDNRYLIYYLDPAKVLVREGKYAAGIDLLVKKYGELVPVEDKLTLGFNELGHASYARTIGLADDGKQVIKIIVGTWMGRIRVEKE